MKSKRKSDAKNYVKLISELSAQLRPKGTKLLAKGANYPPLLKLSLYNANHALLFWTK